MAAKPQSKNICFVKPWCGFAQRTRAVYSNRHFNRNSQNFKAHAEKTDGKRSLEDGLKVS